MKMTTPHFLKRYYITPESVGFTSVVFLLWITSYYAMSIFSNIASSKSPPNDRYASLPDVGFDLLPHLDMLWLTDAFEALLVIPTLFLIITHRKPAYVGNLWFLTSTLCNVERVLSVAITSFPDPRPGCQKITSHFFSTISAHKCGDCMFSGHTVLFVLCACVWTSHPPTTTTLGRILVRCVVWLIVIAASTVVIMNRAHYTVDVLVAWYIGIGNWYLVRYMWKEHCIRHGYLMSINWPYWRPGVPDPRYQHLLLPRPPCNIMHGSKEEEEFRKSSRNEINFDF